MSVCINCGQTENAHGVITDLDGRLKQAREEVAALLAAAQATWRGAYGSSVRGRVDAKDHGFDPEKHSCPHGITPFYPAHGWWCDDCFAALEAAIAATKPQAELPA